jgi:hypothetical protein
MSALRSHIVGQHGFARVQVGFGPQHEDAVELHVLPARSTTNDADRRLSERVRELSV